MEALGEQLRAFFEQVKTLFWFYPKEGFKGETQLVD